MNRLSTENISLSYGRKNIIKNLNLQIHEGEITSIVGPNGCGKSTFLKSMARLIPVEKGCVYLDGHSIHKIPTAEVAKKLGLLFQSSEVPEGISVQDLVSRGRYPHRSFFQAAGEYDNKIISQALELTGLSDMKNRIVDELSGGQRQRAWIAMALAQETPTLLLDEPTTYLDINHRHEIISLIGKLGRTGNRTIITVLHDVNDAANLSDRIIFFKEGGIYYDTYGSNELLGKNILENLFQITCDAVKNPGTDKYHLIPRSRVLSHTSSDSLIYNRGGKAIEIDHLNAGYSSKEVIKACSLSIPKGSITSIIGANASGKSTLLKVIGGHHKESDGTILIQEKDIKKYTKQILAKKLSFLAQKEDSYGDMTVEEFVSIGRYPYQKWYCQWSLKDQTIIENAMEWTNILSLRGRLMHNLSGGEQQRVRLARILSQESDIVILDEPTSFLDISHQIELLDLIWEINRTTGKTVIMVLHDLWQAYRYSDYLVLMKNGQVIGSGKPEEINKTEMIRDAFDVNCHFVPDPCTGKSLVLTV